MKKSSLIVWVLVLCCALAYAGKKFPLAATSVVPAARGDADVSKDRNGNLQLELKIEHLANPESLSPPAVVYIVWFQNAGGSPESQGQLKVDKNLKGSFKTVTPFKNFDLTITAERDASSKSPSGPEVMRATIQP